MSASPSAQALQQWVQNDANAEALMRLLQRIRATPRGHVPAAEITLTHAPPVSLPRSEHDVLSELFALLPPPPPPPPAFLSHSDSSASYMDGGRRAAAAAAAVPVATHASATGGIAVAASAASTSLDRHGCYVPLSPRRAALHRAVPRPVDAPAPERPVHPLPAGHVSRAEGAAPRMDLQDAAGRMR
ncbi:hypothetical protein CAUPRSCDRAFT_12602 [Caulochytrium protostelioides]|uniref:Uncharacterized protein n=1 Tax=Caulochytrium protostelioides TaxID=1555241 RepID=A0A4P9WWD8_9FUNG|nr:hypothetical protein CAUPRSCDRAFT_12602 [Caulochytrium protostelioides]